MSADSQGSSAAVLERSASESSDLRTILLLDPVTLFLRLEETILERREWRIHSARKAEEALDILDREHVDLLVMDHALPDAAGEDLIRAVRANPRTRATGILVLTARGSRPSVEACLEAGANGVLFKPVSRQDLCARVEDLLYVAARRHVRTLVRLNVDASAGGGAVFGSTINVSAGGMLVEFPEPVERGVVFDVRFALPGDLEPIAVRARVVRVTSAGGDGHHAVGLAFEGIPEAERARIEAFVTSNRSDGAAFAPATSG